MLLSHVFFVVFAQSTAFLFKRWWLSLSYILAYTLMVQWVFHPYLPPPLDLGVQVWVYRFLPALIGWAAAAGWAEWLYPERKHYPPILGSSTAITFWGVIEAVMVHAAMLPAMLGTSVASLSLVAFFMTINWTIYYLSHRSVVWRFDCAEYADRFYRLYYIPTIALTLFSMFIGVLVTDGDEFSPSRFSVSLLSVIISSAYLLLVTLIQTKASSSSSKSD